jgi:hypothetical protein
MFKKLKKKYWEQGFDDGYKIGYEIGASGVCEEPADDVKTNVPSVTGLTVENGRYIFHYLDTTSDLTNDFDEDDFDEDDLNNLIGEGFEI